MTVNNFYQPSPPTNWRDKLSEVYSRQSEQLREHHANLRDRDQQELARAKEESFVATFQGLAEFSTSVAKLVKAAGEGKGKDKDDDDTKQKVANLLKQIESVDLGEEVKTYDGNKKNVWKDSEFWDSLKKNNTHLKDVLTDIQKFDPREQILMREMLALNSSQNLKGQFADIPIGSNDYKPENWDKLNATQQAEYEVQFGINELIKFGVSKEFAANILVGDIKRQNETTRGLARAVSSNKYNQTLTQRSKIYLGITSIAENPNLFSQNIGEQIRLRKDLYTSIENGGPTAQQQAAAAVFQEVLSLADEGYIPSYALANIEGYIVKHSAAKGKKGNIFETFFLHDPDAKDNFTAAVKRGQSKLVETAAREDNIAFNELQQGAYNNLPPEQLDRFIQRLKSRGNLSEKQLNKLEKFNITAQSPEYEQLALDNWTPKLNTGLIGVTQEDINAIDNNAVRKKVQLSFDKLAYHNGLHGNNEGSLKSIIHAAYSSQPYTEGQKLSAWGEMISNDLDREVAGKRLQLIMAQYDDNGNLVAPNENIEGDIAALKEGLWKMRGGGTASGLYGQTQDGVGKFENYIRAKATMSRVDSRDFHHLNYDDSVTIDGVTSTARDVWTKQFYNTLENIPKNEAGLPDRQFAIENGLLLNNDDLAGVFNDLTYSHKIYTMARLANTDPATLVLKKKASLLKSKDPIDIKFRENWGLGSKDTDKVVADTAIVKYLNQVYEKLDDPNSNTAYDIQFLIKKGWKWLDKVQQERVYLYLTNEFNTDEDKAQIDKDTEEELKRENAQAIKDNAPIAMEELGNK